MLLLQTPPHVPSLGSVQSHKREAGRDVVSQHFQSFAVLLPHPIGQYLLCAQKGGILSLSQAHYFQQEQLL